MIYRFLSDRFSLNQRVAFYTLMLVWGPGIDVCLLSGLPALAAASGSTPVYAPEILAIETPLGNPWDVAYSPDGHLIFSDTQRQYLFRVNEEGIISILAGNGMRGRYDESDRATEVAFNEPRGLAASPDGAIYIADSGNHRVRRIDSNGTIRTVAGTGVSGYSGDGGPATAAQLNSPYGLSLDEEGNLYIADMGNRLIRRVQPSGMIDTVVGSGASRSNRGGATARQFSLESPVDVDARQPGHLAIADRYASKIYEVKPDGSLRTIAGGGKNFPVEGVSATSVELRLPTAVHLETDGSVIFTDAGYKAVFRVAEGRLHLLTSLVPSIPSESGPSSSVSGESELTLSSPVGVTRSPTGIFAIADWSAHRIFYVGEENQFGTLAGTGEDADRVTDSQARRSLQPIHLTRGLVALPDGSLVYTDPSKDRIFRLIPGQKIESIQVSNGQTSPDAGHSYPSGELYGPSGLVMQPDGSLLFTEIRSHRIRKMNPDGLLSHVAGIGAPGYSGDKIPASRARFWHPSGLAQDLTRKLYIADTLNHRIRVLYSDGALKTLPSPRASTDTDGVLAPPAPLKEPTAIVVTPSDEVIVADTGNFLVRATDGKGEWRTLAGGGTASPEIGQLAVAARLWEPVALAYAPDGTLAIADITSHRVWGVDSEGRISFMIGSGTEGRQLNEDPLQAELSQPNGLAYNSEGDLFIVTRDRVLRYSSEGKLDSVGDERVSGWGEYYEVEPERSTWSDRLKDATHNWKGNGNEKTLRWLTVPHLVALGPGEAMIAWETSRSAWAVIEYGEGRRLDREIRLTSSTARGSVMLEGLQPDRNYRFRVRLFRLPGEGTFSLVSDIEMFKTREPGAEITYLVPDGLARGSASGDRLHPPSYPATNVASPKDEKTLDPIDRKTSDELIRDLRQVLGIE